MTVCASIFGTGDHLQQCSISRTYCTPESRRCVCEAGRQPGHPRHGMMERVGLAVVWGALAYTLNVGNDHRVPDALWAGALAAISGMEAWVKFGAPLLPKYIALSVGGRVFQHLEACEWGLLLGSLAAHRRDTTVLAVGGILTLQSLLIAPHLQRVAKHRIVEALTIKQQASPRQELSEAEAAILSAYEPQVRGFRAMKWMHVAFVLAEAAKLALLLVGSERLLGWL